MSIRLLRFLNLLSQSLSFRAGAFAIAAIVAALAAVMFAGYVPDELAELLGGSAVDRVLAVMASSMLVVVTFSLSTLIASYSVAGSSAPSRATSLIMRDKSAQNALSTFLGAFIFSIVSLVALSTKYYGSHGRVILFVFTLLVLGAVIWTIIRWIGQLSGLGLLSTVIKSVVQASSKAIENQSCYFCWEKTKFTECPKDALKVKSTRTGFVQTIDLKSISNLAEKNNWEVWISAVPGSFVYPGFVLAEFSPREKMKEEIEKDWAKDVRASFYVGKARTFQDDPRYGFIVLSEIASRALSPGINDPGTAIQIIVSLTDLVVKTREASANSLKPDVSERIHLKKISPDDILDDAFHAISRDGAALVEVVLFMQKAFHAIYHYPEFKSAVRISAQKSLDHCSKAMRFEKDFERVKMASILSEMPSVHT